MNNNPYTNHIELTLSSLQKIPDVAKLNGIIERFFNKRVVFCTMGKSAYACRKVVYTARSYGLDWHDLDVCHAFHGDAGIVKPGDLLVLVSKSGETKETIAVAEYFSSYETVAITSGEDSSLSALCDEHIYIPVETEGSPFGYAPMISTTLYMILLHGIMCVVVEQSDLTIEDYARNHPFGTIGALLINDGVV